MPILQYTPNQLLHLRASPLVKKPEDLPAIEQWIDESNQQQQQQQKDSSARRVQRPVAGANGDASPMGNFSTGQRPSLMQTRSAVSRSGDDIVLGPPKTAFASSRTIARLAEMGDKASAPSSNDATPGDEPEIARARAFGDRQQNRKSQNTNELEGRADRESWTSARERRMLAEQDEGKVEGGERNGRYNNRRNNDSRDQDGERRNGFGDKQERRWGNNRDDNQNGEKRQGGWRDRERERRGERGFGRNDHDEKEPEWFDEPAALQKQEDDLGMGTVRTQEDFQKWKETMHARNKGQSEEPEMVPMEAPPTKEATPAKSASPLKLDSMLDRPFGGFNEPKPTSVEAKFDNMPTPAKSAAGKGKSSRFASMFKKPEDVTPTFSGNAQLPDGTSMQQLAEQAANGSSEDKEGFQRILQMLGGNGIGGLSIGGQLSSQTGPSVHQSDEPTSPPPKSVANGTRKRSRFFDSAPKSPERLQSPPQSGFQPQYSSGESEILGSNRGMSEELSSMFAKPANENRPSRRAPPVMAGEYNTFGVRLSDGFRLSEKQPDEQPRRSQPAVNAALPEPMPGTFGTRDQGPPGRPHELGREDPPSRGAATPDINIQNLLAAQRAQRQQAPNKDSQFLLGLLQGQTSRSPSQQARSGPDFPLWLEQPPEPHAPKPRQPPPPGLIDEHLLRNTPRDLPRQEPQHQYMSDHMPARRTSQRVPPPGFDEQSLFIQQQQHHRRNFTEPPQQHQQPPPGRRMSGHPGLSQMQTQQPQYHPEFPFLQSPGGHQQGPPPGFPPNMRHPQGYATIPNIFQAAQPQQREPNLFANAQPQQQREPPGYGGMVQQQARVEAFSPPNPPPGFAMPGMPPGLVQMRSPTESISGAAGFRANGRGYDAFDGMRR